MRFGSYLLEQRRPAWAAHYVDYARLKALLAAVRAAPLGRVGLGGGQHTTPHGHGGAADGMALLLLRNWGSEGADSRVHRVAVDI